MFDNIRIVLLNTTHPGNIGGAARAMKNMGLTHLTLVAPKHYPNPEAQARASGAEDVLEKAVIVDTIEEALADCTLIYGTSARIRNLPWVTFEPRECANQIAKEKADTPIAILFGEERIGLTNEQLEQCHYQVTIPTNPEYSSLNLAAAVQIITYELRMAALQHQPNNRMTEEEYATAKELQLFYKHIENVLIETEFHDPEQPGRMMLRLKRLFNRARPEVQEINILRGMLTAIQKKYKS